ncbi:MAG: flavodoxin domain-containing protein [Actinomycetota bacterium]
MKAVVVFESLYGNTRAVAEAVAEGLRDGGDVAFLPVGDAGPEALTGADLLVVGGPTHVHGMSSERSRAAAADDARKHPEKAPPDVDGPALRTWLDGLPRHDGRLAAGFDTRLDKPAVLTGAASHGIAKRLRRHGFAVLDEESFLVTGGEGPLAPGERERARAWGAELARAALARR